MVAICTSGIWSYFAVSAVDNALMCRVNYRLKSVSRSGTSSRTFNISNLGKQMQRKHNSDKFRLLEDSKKKCRQDKQQSTINEAMQKKQQHDFNHPEIEVSVSL